MPACVSGRCAARASLVTRSKRDTAFAVSLFCIVGRGSNRASASAEERPRWGLSVPACVSGRCAARESLVTRSKKKDATKVASFLFGPADRGSNRASALSFFRRAPGCACRGRCRAQLFATKERYRCGLPLAGTHQPAFLNQFFSFSLRKKRTVSIFQEKKEGIQNRKRIPCRHHVTTH